MVGKADGVTAVFLDVYKRQDEGREAKQSVTILSLVSSVPPLAEIITGMD